MRFTLTYEGELRSNDDYRRKWEIRRQFAPQLEELWRIHPSLKSVSARRLVPINSGFFLFERHHSLPAAEIPRPTEETIDLLTPINVGGRDFLPLVRNTLALQCGLKILFLRKEPPGKVYQGDDLDNRLKTLLDALAVPNQDQVIREVATDPVYCLAEDDGLITRVDIDTQRLLAARTNASHHEVKLIIEVDVRVTDTRLYNQPFLGD